MAVWGLCGQLSERKVLTQQYPDSGPLIIKQEKARCRKRPLCGSHRPAEPGRRARNCGLFRH